MINEPDSSVWVVVFFIAGCAGKLLIIGLNERGLPVVANVDERKYAEHLSEGLLSVRESVLPALDRQAEKETKWKLRTAVIGFAVKGEAGFGPFKMGIKPRIRAAFANGEKPPIP